MKVLRHTCMGARLLQSCVLPTGLMAGMGNCWNWHQLVAGVVWDDLLSVWVLLDFFSLNKFGRLRLLLV